MIHCTDEQVEHRSGMNQAVCGRGATPERRRSWGFVGFAALLMVVVGGYSAPAARVAGDPAALLAGVEPARTAATFAQLPSEPAARTPEAPPAAGGLAPMKVEVQRMTDISAERIVLSIGRGSLVNVSEAIKRASVADPKIADVTVLSPRQVLVAGNAVGTTELVLWDQADNQVVFEVVVEADLTAVRRAIEELAPGSQVQVRAVRDTIVVSGVVPDVDAAEHVMQLVQTVSSRVQNQLKIAGEQQVLLRCTVAEVNKQSARQLGVNGWIAGDNVRDMFAVTQVGGINPVNIGAARQQDILTPNGMIFTTDRTNGLPLSATPTLSLGFPRVQMQLFLLALRTDGLLRVLAEPNLVALNGQEASFLVGGEIPYPVPQQTGTPAVQFRPFGIQLRFRPTVIGRQMVRLTVMPEVSEPDFSVQFNGVPGLRSRSASTTIELASGSTIAIAGLLSEQVRAQVQRIPGLGDVPVLGALFSSTSYQRATTELVVLVTPELVSAMHPDQVPAVPGEFMTEPDDMELFGLGRLEGKPRADDAAGDALATETAPRYRKFSCSPEQMSLHGEWGPAEAWETTQ